MIDIFDQDWRYYAIAVGLLASLACIGLFAWRRLMGRGAFGNDSAMLSIVLNNMTQGVVMFDSAERLVVCNERYIDMYRLSRDVVRPGALLIDVIKNRKLTGSLNIDPEKYRAQIVALVRQGNSASNIVETPDGRAVSVVNRAIKGGKFWIGTHDDITERIQAERKSAALGEHKSAAAWRLSRKSAHFARTSRWFWGR